MPRHVMRAVLVTTLVVGLRMPAVTAQTGVASDAMVKAAFLVNFAKFVTWPPDNQRPARTAFSICVLGDDQVLESLGQRSATVQGLATSARSVSETGGFAACQMLFIGRAVASRPEVLGAAVRGAPVLVVSDRPEDAAVAAISLVPVEGRLAFDINLDAARESRLGIGSQLLGIARRVRGRR